MFQFFLNTLMGIFNFQNSVASVPVCALAEPPRLQLHGPEDRRRQRLCLLCAQPGQKPTQYPGTRHLS